MRSSRHAPPNSGLQFRTSVDANRFLGSSQQKSNANDWLQRKSNADTNQLHGKNQLLVSIYTWYLIALPFPRQPFRMKESLPVRIVRWLLNKSPFLHLKPHIHVDRSTRDLDVSFSGSAKIKITVRRHVQSSSVCFPQDVSQGAIVGVEAQAPDMSGSMRMRVAPDRRRESVSDLLPLCVFHTPELEIHQMLARHESHDDVGDVASRHRSTSILHDGLPCNEMREAWRLGIGERLQSLELVFGMLAGARDGRRQAACQDGWSSGRGGSYCMATHHEERIGASLIRRIRLYPPAYSVIGRTRSKAAPSSGKSTMRSNSLSASSRVRPWFILVGLDGIHVAAMEFVGGVLCGDVAGSDEWRSGGISNDGYSRPGGKVFDRYTSRNEAFDQFPSILAPALSITHKLLY
ncbi:uncharacterized protein MYCFIDRAFT_208634 [Pseudocercospora fijiensis CIRAD86]|uniref:Uncharacterized protein n=1 Tax=Pseudocercospora fijiensis (strain CIRAD86) TaxID=383855 RepID=M2ZNK4_PSEFD|nr:uncharacterized protein MYCFIDRAFT_208634 [Pseudocercospora fijiensis CIRAD86]EME80674.1 hypothetical protein MYCFIDRAFT_208634 [Pseudocercospora fijiensis CIRAD86]